MSLRLLVGRVFPGALFLCVSLALEAAPPAKLLLVDDFEGGQQNKLGGFHEKYQSGDSIAVIARDANVRRGRGGSSLSVQADRRATGYCGVWLQFFNFRAPLRQYFDTRPFGYLSFWVKGQAGGEQFTVKLADGRWIEKEDSLAVGEIRRFLPKGVTTQWQEVLVPLATLKGLDLQYLGGLTLDFTSPGRHVVWIDDISFKTTATMATPLMEVASTEAAATTVTPRAMWLWESQGVLQDAAQREELFTFCRNESIEQLWMQLDYQVVGRLPREAVVVPLNPPASTGLTPTSTASPSTAATKKPPVQHVTCTLPDPGAWRRFLEEAHQARLQVHALDGYPEFALKPQHAVPLAVVDAVIAFNRESSAEQRFDGIHFDNEPYLLLGWEDRTRREQILREFLELNVECQRRVRTQSGLSFGIDIPFWWQELDTVTGKAQGEVTFGGKKKPASHHCIDLLDQVGIMNYRDAAEGADGMIAHGQELLAYADHAGAARIHMGVETFQSPPADVWFVVGLPRKRFEAIVRGAGKELAALSRVDGLRLHRLDDGQHVHVGLELPTDPTDADLARVQQHLAQIAERFGAIAPSVPRSQIALARNQAEGFVRLDPEWSGFRSRDIVTTSGPELAGFLATTVMLSKITFADNTLDELHRQLSSAETTFRRTKHFAGTAIHSYESFRKLGNVKRLAAQP